MFLFLTAVNRLLLTSLMYKLILYVGGWVGGWVVGPVKPYVVGTIVLFLDPIMKRLSY